MKQATLKRSETAQFTITIAGATSQDMVNIAIASSAINQSKTIWKLNGIVQDNQEALSLTQNQLTLSYKAVINGQVKNNEQNITVSNKGFTLYNL